MKAIAGVGRGKERRRHFEPERSLDGTLDRAGLDKEKDKGWMAPCLVLVAGPLLHVMWSA